MQAWARETTEDGRHGGQSLRHPGSSQRAPRQSTPNRETDQPSGASAAEPGRLGHGIQASEPVELRGPETAGKGGEEDGQTTHTAQSGTPTGRTKGPTPDPRATDVCQQTNVRGSHGSSGSSSPSRRVGQDRKQEREGKGDSRSGGGKEAHQAQGSRPFRRPAYRIGQTVQRRRNPAPTVLQFGRISAAINIALFKAKAPAHVRIEVIRRSAKGSLTATAIPGADAKILLHFREEILQAARNHDHDIVDVRSNENWPRLKVLVPVAPYCEPDGLEALKEEIEAENGGIEVTTRVRWLKPWALIRQHQPPWPRSSSRYGTGNRPSN